MKQVLLIDASPLFHDYLKDKLQAEQIGVETAVGNRDAYTKLLSSMADLIIIDVEKNFDVLVDFLEKKRRDPNACKTPIIMVGPSKPRVEVAALSKYTVVKYFSKPIKFDIFFSAIGKILHANFVLDNTPSVIEVHCNGNVIFIEAARGLNKDKIQILRYRIEELINTNNLKEPKVLLMISGLTLTFADGYNLELLFDNILADKRIMQKNIKVLTLDTFTKELLEGHPQYNSIEIAESLDSVINSLIDTSLGHDVNTTISEKLLVSNDNNALSEVETRFNMDIENPKEDEKAQGETLKVAIVDDDSIIIKLIQNAFTPLSAKVEPFQAGIKFLEATKTQTFDIVILDLFIPDMNGLDILRTLQKERFKTPIIVYSQATTRDAVVQALSMGASSYIVKPQKPDVIVQKAVEVLNAQSRLF